MDDVLIIVLNTETGEYVTTLDGESDAGTDWSYIAELTTDLAVLAEFKMRNQLENE